MGSLNDTCPAVEALLAGLYLLARFTSLLASLTRVVVLVSPCCDNSRGHRPIDPEGHSTKPLAADPGPLGLACLCGDNVMAARPGH